MLALQRSISLLCLPIVAPLLSFVMVGIARYKCHNIEAVRNHTRQLLLRAGDRPLILCPNHLTMIDSVILIWLLFGCQRLLTSPRCLIWHMPEAKNVSGSLLLRFVCYIGRCISVERGGSIASNRKAIEKFRHLLCLGDVVCIFPEGTRSRTGRVEEEQVTYSVGELCQNTNAVVLCIYLRSQGQSTFGVYPHRKAQFYIDLHLMEPTLTTSGRRVSRELGRQINATLRQMEAKYFAQNCRSKKLIAAD